MGLLRPDCLRAAELADRELVSWQEVWRWRMQEPGSRWERVHESQWYRKQEEQGARLEWGQEVRTERGQEARPETSVMKYSERGWSVV